jgi:neutral ceramidase
MSFNAGFSKKEITPFFPGLVMMGFGQLHNHVKDVATPLWARAMFLEDAEKNPFLYIHLELAFVTQAIKEKVSELVQSLHPEWGVNENSILITAQHTHSAPGGYSHYPFYNLSIPHFQPKVFNCIVDGIMAAAADARKSLAPVTLEYGEYTLPESSEVAFNRSMRAYRNNPEADQKAESHQAVDRCMRGMIIKNAAGKLLGFINWFGVHCTSISSFNSRIHSDNKGVAATLFETAHAGVTAFFAQEAAGDISPNFIWDKKTKLMRGKFSDQYESCAFNGELQFRASEKITAAQKITGRIKTEHIYVDMTKKTTAPAHGVAFFKGTLEGPGAPAAVTAVCTVLSKAIRSWQLCTAPEKHREFYRQQFPKNVILDHRDGKFVGMTPAGWSRLPALPEPTAELFRLAARSGALKTLPWVPSIIPLQRITIGELMIVTIPGEITTVAAARLKTALEKKFLASGISKVIVASYANAFIGYITTREEYQAQCYEGGHNVYGAGALDAIIDSLVTMTDEGLKPFRFPPAELALRTAT